MATRPPNRPRLREVAGLPALTREIKKVTKVTPNAVLRFSGSVRAASGAHARKCQRFQRAISNWTMAENPPVGQGQLRRWFGRAGSPLSQARHGELKHSAPPSPGLATLPLDLPLTRRLMAACDPVQAIPAAAPERRLLAGGAVSLRLLYISTFTKPSAAQKLVSICNRGRLSRPWCQQRSSNTKRTPCCKLRQPSRIAIARFSQPFSSLFCSRTFCGDFPNSFGSLTR